MLNSFLGFLVAAAVILFLGFGGERVTPTTATDVLYNALVCTGEIKGGWHSNLRLEANITGESLAGSLTYLAPIGNGNDKTYGALPGSFLRQDSTTGEYTLHFKYLNLVGPRFFHDITVSGQSLLQLDGALSDEPLGASVDKAGYGEPKDVELNCSLFGGF